MARAAAPVPAPRSRKVNASRSANGNSWAMKRNCSDRLRSRASIWASQSRIMAGDFQISAFVSCASAVIAYPPLSCLLPRRSFLAARGREGLADPRAVGRAEVLLAAVGRIVDEDVGLAVVVPDPDEPVALGGVVADGVGDQGRDAVPMGRLGVQGDAGVVPADVVLDDQIMGDLEPFVRLELDAADLLDAVVVADVAALDDVERAVGQRDAVAGVIPRAAADQMRAVD